MAYSIKKNKENNMKEIETINKLIESINELQAGEGRCREFAIVITKLEEAVHWLEHRQSKLVT